jgi:hypothetical protein
MSANVKHSYFSHKLMRMDSRLLLVVFTALWFGCASGPTHQHVPEDFLKSFCGKWEDISKENRHIEEWDEAGPGQLEGMGFVLAGLDTVFIEHLAIKPVDGTLSYIATVGNQNGSQPVSFVLESHAGNKLVFANTTHDFPQRIIYEIISNTEMWAYIEGYEEGEFKRVKFSFIRASN